MSRKSAITTLEKRIEKLQKRNEILINAEFRQCKEIEKLVQDNRKLQSELEQERHFAEGLSKANEVLARKYRAEKARADAMAKFLKEERDQMRYGIMDGSFLIETYDTPEEAYEAAKFAYEETGSFHGVVAITPFEEEVSKLQETVSAYHKRQLELVNALMNIKRELAWGDAENAVSKAIHHIDNILKELCGGEIDNE